MKAEETAIYLYNKAIKKLNLFNCHVTKQAAIECACIDLLIIKEALYNLSLLDNLTNSQYKNTFNHYQKVKTLIENF